MPRQLWLELPPATPRQRTITLSPMCKMAVSGNLWLDLQVQGHVAQPLFVRFRRAPDNSLKMHNGHQCRIVGRYCHLPLAARHQDQAVQRKDWDIQLPELQEADAFLNGKDISNKILFCLLYS